MAPIKRYLASFIPQPENIGNHSWFVFTQHLDGLRSTGREVYVQALSTGEGESIYRSVIVGSLMNLLRDGILETY